MPRHYLLLGKRKAMGPMRGLEKEGFFNWSTLDYLQSLRLSLAEHLRR